MGGDRDRNRIEIGSKFWGGGIEIGSNFGGEIEIGSRSDRISGGRSKSDRIGSKSDQNGRSKSDRNRIEIGSNFARGLTWDFWTRGVPRAISDK